MDIYKGILGFAYPLFVRVISPIFKRLKKSTTLFLSSFQWTYGFSGNVKYLFLYSSNTKWKDTLNPIIILKSLSEVNMLKNCGYNAIYYPSLQTIKSMARAKVVLSNSGVDSTNYAPLLWGARHIDMWHGLPIKKIDLPPPSKCPFRKYLLEPWSCVWRQYGVAPSSTMAEIFSRAWHLPVENIIKAGYPRTEFLLKGLHAKEFTGWEIGIPQNTLELILKKKNFASSYIMYMPTFRKEWVKIRQDNVIGYLPQVYHDPIANDKILDLKALNTLLEKHDAIFLIKYHYYHAGYSALTKRIISQDLAHIKLLPPNLDPYPLLRVSDILITDYSSVMFDFLVLDRPILLYPYDLKIYEKTQGLYFNYEDVAPGSVSFDFDALLKNIEVAMDDPKVDQDKRRKAFKVAYENDYKRILNSSEILCQFIFNGF